MRRTRSRFDWAMTLSILVEAAAGLAAEVAVLNELEQAGRDLGPDLAADRRGDVEAYEVQQGQRAPRVAGAQLHAGVDRLGVEAQVEHPHRREQIGEQQAVHDEPWDRRHFDGGLP